MAQAPAPLPHLGLVLGTWAASVSETAGTASDSVSAAWIAGVVFGDSATADVIVSRGFIFNDTFSESLSSTSGDSFTNLVTFGGVLSETVAAADVPAVTGSMGMAFTDSAAAADLPAGGFTAPYTDAAASAEAFDAAQLAHGGDAAPLPHLGLMFNVGVKTADFSESAASDDTRAAAVAFAGDIINASLLAIENFSRITTFAGAFTDSGASADAFLGGVQGAVGASFSEAAGTTGESFSSLFAVPVDFSESVAAAEAVASTSAPPAAFSDAGASAEAFADTVLAVGAFSESPGTSSESFSSTAIAVASVAEALGAGDSFDPVEAYASDAFNRAVVMVADFSESSTVDLSTVGQAGGVVMSESSIAAESMHAASVGVAAFSEASGTLSDAFTEGLETPEAFAESAAAADVPDATIGYAVGFQESAASADASLVAFGVDASLSAETVAAAMQFDSARIVSADIAESGLAADINATGTALLSDVTEQALADDLVDGASVAPNMYTESAGVFDALDASFVVSTPVFEGVVTGAQFDAIPGSSQGLVSPVFGFDQSSATLISARSMAEIAGALDGFDCIRVVPVVSVETVQAEQALGATQDSTPLIVETGRAADDFHIPGELGWIPLIAIDGSNRTLTVDGGNRMIVVDEARL